MKQHLILTLTWLLVCTHTVLPAHITAVPLPTAPDQVYASVISATRIDIRWRDNSSETSFRINRCAGAACTPTVEIGSTAANATTYSDTTASAATIYRYCVASRDGTGDSSCINTSFQVTSLASGRSLNNIKIYPQSIRLTIGRPKTAVIIGYQDNGANDKAIFGEPASSDATKATVSSPFTENNSGPYQEQTGRIIQITGVAAGTTNITATTGGITSDACAITVDDPAASPTATLSGDVTNGGTITTKIGEPIDVFGDNSVGVDRILWTWGDGTTARDVLSGTHAYLAAGSYSASLRVTNTSGATSTASFTVSVSAHSAGSTCTAGSVSALLTCWTNAVGGDTIQIAKNAILSGGAVDLPFKSLSSYITIQSDGTLPALTKRISSTSTELATIQSTVNNAPALNLADGQTRVRFRGIKFDIDAAHFTYVLVQVGSNSQTLASQNPEKIIFEHCAANTLGNYNIYHAFTNNGYKVALLSSDFMDIGGAGVESQAVFSVNGRGAHVYYNDHVQATTENTLYGGGTTTIPYQVPTNIEWRNCYFDKNPAWKDSAYTWKNLFEIKTGRRVYVYGCYFYLQYNQGQKFAIAVKSSNEGDDSPWVRGEDVTFDSCRAKSLSGGIGNAWDKYNDTVTPKPNNIRFLNFLWEDLNATTYGSFGYLHLSGEIDDQRIEHNTVSQPDITNKGVLTFTHTNGYRYVMQDTIMPFHTGGIANANGGEVGTAALDLGSGNLWTWKYNVHPNASSISTTGYPGTGSPNFNSYPATIAAVGFTDYANGNYQLTVGSTYHNAASDGTDPGVDFAALKTALGASSSNFASATFKVITGDWAAGNSTCKWSTNPACQ